MPTVGMSVSSGLVVENVRSIFALENQIPGLFGIRFEPKQVTVHRVRIALQSIS